MSDTSSKSNALWGGRFSGGPSEIMREINASIFIDRRLAPEDIAGSRAHCRMLAEVGLISGEDAAKILEGLDTVEAEIASGAFQYSVEREDIHMHVEARLAELIGEPAGRLHTARSRNDQVATDFRLHVRAACGRLDAGLRDLQAALIDQAERHAGTVMPGFTHLQSAQPVSLGHHLMAYVEMFGRDRDRARAAAERLNECPLGSAALAGTSFPLDREMTARELGFARPMRNSMDAVSSRDFALDYLAAAAICGAHLSRLAEEIVIWCSEPFSFIRLSDAFTTGSSIMPQKRNPDAAELIRAKAARLSGLSSGLLGVVKGLPMAYAKDLQEDKKPVFEAEDDLDLMLAAMSGMIRDMEARPDRMRAAAALGHPTATDLADWLVRERKTPFRRAHHVAGRCVAAAEAKGVGLAELPLEELREICADMDAGALLSLEESLASRNSFGGTAPSRVRAAVAEARKLYLEREG